MGMEVQIMEAVQTASLYITNIYQEFLLCLTDLSNVLKFIVSLYNFWMS